MKQLIAEKFDTSKLRPEMEIHEVIMAQYSYDFGESNCPISVSDLYMSEPEQDKMFYWILKNLKPVKRLPRIMREKKLNMVRLDIFPSSIKK